MSYFDYLVGIQNIDLSQGLAAASWDQLPNTPAQIVCQPDIEPSESDQSQDDLVDSMKVSTSVNLEDSLLDAVIKEEPDSDGYVVKFKVV